METMAQDFVDGAHQLPSPNYDERPLGTEINLLVIHNISLPPGQFGGSWIDDLFLNRLDPDADPYFQNICKLRVAAHLLIRRDGALVQYVPLSKRAWHAGQSAFQDCSGCNDFSIGIELEGTDDLPYADAQYQTLAQVTHQIMQYYPVITPERIVGHDEIAPGRKTDPGPAFDWHHFKGLLATP